MKGDVFCYYMEEKKDLFSDSFQVLSELTTDFALILSYSEERTFKLEWATPGLERLTGYSFQELKEPGKLMDIVHHQDRKALKKQMEKLFYGPDKETEIEYRIITARGRLHWVEDKMRIFFRAGNKRLLRGVRDITEVRETELELKKTLVEQRLLLNNIDTQIWCLKDEKTYGMVNQAHADFLGISRYELESSSLVEYFKVDDQRSFIDDNRRVFEEKRRKSSEEWVIDSLGEKRLLSINRVPSLDIEGEVEHVVCTAEDITEKRMAEQEVRYLSFHDHLTGLYNRAYMEEEMKRLDTFRQLPISIIMGDLNGLKMANDTFGHQQGDILICKAAEVISGCCRKEDIIARWGGDEFMILLPKRGEKEALQMIKRIKENCKKVQETPVPLSIAFGCSQKEEPGQNLYDVLRQAEDWMYQKKLVESRSARSTILSTLLKTLGEKSYETEEHAWRLQKLGLQLGEAIGLTGVQLNNLSLLVSLHDIGKVAIPEDILCKEEALTREEWELIKTHTEAGYRIARSSEDFAHLADGILSHHEFWDGSGYPRGVGGRRIPLLARITSIVDAYDVMVNGRPYKPSVSKEEALGELRCCAGTQFDPELVSAFIEQVGK